MAESNRIPGPKPGKPLEKLNFSQTCTLLSQLLKEKRTIGVGMPGNKPESKEKAETFRAPATPMNLFLNKIDYQAGTSTQITPPPVTKSPNFFQKLVSNSEDSNKADPSKTTMTTTTTLTKAETAQMTIFYNGKVIVINDLPSDKAEEVMALARKGSSSPSASVSTTEKIDNSANIIININESPDDPESNININNTPVPKSDQKNTKFPTPERVSQERSPAEPTNVSDLPIARRNSLHRFLEKRKDRVAAKAPYQVNNRAPVAPPKPADEGNMQAESSEQLELKL